MLLVDDTWTSGANTLAADNAPKNAGAATVALIVLGRYLRDDFQRAGGPSGAAIYRRLPSFVVAPRRSPEVTDPPTQ